MAAMAAMAPPLPTRLTGNISDDVGKWNRWKLEYVLSNTENGYINVFKNGVLIGSVRGKTAIGDNTVTYRWSQGIYTQSRSTGKGPRTVNDVHLLCVIETMSFRLIFSLL